MLLSASANQIHRHRFIATYLSRLIRTGFQFPNQVLNDFVFGMTGFQLSDCDESPALPVQLEKPRGFNFSSLSESEHLIEFSGVILISIADPKLLRTVAEFVLEYAFAGKIRGLNGDIGESMVEYGVSRFKGRVAETDEPLAILALVNFVEQEKKVTLEGHLRSALNTSDPGSRGIAFETFGAYLLARAFSDPTPLSKVFEFVGGGNEALQDELAELVTVEKDGKDFRTIPLKFKTNSRPSHVLGRSPSTVTDTLGWLRNPQGSAFCFPANAVGPDLIFLLRLTSNSTILPVCVQFKHTDKLSPQDWEKVIRTTDPSTFLSRQPKGTSSPTCSDLSMRKMKDAIKVLGNGTKKAGHCRVLRVVFSYPSFPDSNALEKAAKGDNPLATVPLSLLAETCSDLRDDILPFVKVALQLPDRKRKSSDEIKGARPKKKKRN